MPFAPTLSASTAPRTPRIVTTRTSLFHRGGMAREKQRFREKGSGIFFAADLDRANHVETADEIRFCAQSVSRVFGRPMARSRNEIGAPLPVGRNAEIVGWVSRRRNPPCNDPESKVVGYASLTHPTPDDGCPGSSLKTRFALLPGHDERRAFTTRCCSPSPAPHRRRRRCPSP